jgi:hypothetical protein
MTHQSRSATRRNVLGALTVLGGAAALGVPFGATASRAAALAEQALDSASRTRDWEWLIGQWDVAHRRLKERLAGSTEWETFNGRSALWLTLGGLGTVDDNLLGLPGGTYRATGIRAFNPANGQWAIWWLDGRHPTRIDPPVYGRFDIDSATFIGHDTFEGRPIQVRFRWLDIHGRHPLWEQAFSPDGGATWEINWHMKFTRTSSAEQPLPAEGGGTPPDVPDDWAFLEGLWDVRHRRLEKRLAGSKDWVNFDGTLHNRAVMGGAGNVSDNVMSYPSEPFRGVGIRSYDAATKQWLSWWLDGRNPATIGPPVRGSFSDGVGTFTGADTHDGREILARVRWSRLTARSAHWEQAFSADGGRSWEVNWTSSLTRRG